MKDAGAAPGALRPSFTPALGHRALTPLYDAAIAALTRERAWRARLVEAIDVQDGERLLDVGCGTGSLLLVLSHAAPGAALTGLDPDADVLGRARAKAKRVSAAIQFETGFLDEAILARHARFDVVVSSLVLHQTPLEAKRRILMGMHDALQCGGRLCIADYGRQSGLMRVLFRLTVQALDGVEDTQPNADGVLPALMREAGFAEIFEFAPINTLTGSISIWTARRT